jgi:glyoxylate/hydroxypyruvate reductase
VAAVATARRTEPSRPLVLLWLDEADRYAAEIDAAGLGRRIELAACAKGAEPPAEVLGQAEILLSWGPPAGTLNRMPRLRWVQTLTSGVDDWLAREDVDGRFVLMNARGVHRIQMPENILGAIFHVTKPLARAGEQQREERWARLVSEPIAGKTLGIVGLGAIGTEVARKAKALEMRVIGVRRTVRPTPWVDEVFALEELDSMLAQADFVLLVVPATAETTGLMDARRFAAMKRGAWLLNFGRGELIVDDALIRAVTGGHVAGAVLDAFRVEPLPAGHPFWSTPNILVLPHMGGAHPDRSSLVAEVFLRNLRLDLDHGRLEGAVDPARGY